MIVVALGRYVLTAQVTIPAGTLSYPAASTPITTTGTTSATPSAGTAVTSQVVAAATAGTYLLSWTATLQTAAAAGDANNFGLYNGSTLLATSVNAGTVGSYPQAPVLAQIASGSTVAIKNIAVGSTGAVYAGSLTTVLTTAGDIKGCVAWDGPGSPPGWAEGFPITFFAGQPLWLDSAGPLYAVLAGNLRAWIDGQDNVGHAALSN